ncbi:MAG: succinate dehydrogenase assembly factor 2 [Betaproteobacteria bacterium]|nr:succinate dehydrogenase assembly factor 2 [Betaproteobacteria bacterium]
MAQEIDSRVYERIRWRARRGLLENDILLSRFFSAQLMQLSPEELGWLEKLLQIEDNDLLDLLMGRSSSSEPQIAALVEKIRAA